MPTQAESRALAFFAGLFALGGLLRFVDTLRPTSDAATGDPAALDAQLARLDTVRSHGASNRPSRGKATTRRAGADTTAPVVAPPPGLPPELAAMAGWFSRSPQEAGARARQPATPKSRGPAPRVAAARPSDERHTTADPPVPIDLDTASEAEIEALPGIGPSLARRIVADRTAHGAFGSLEGLGRVKGVGAVLSARLAQRVTFSGIARPD